MEVNLNVQRGQVSVPRGTSILTPQESWEILAAVWEAWADCGLGVELSRPQADEPGRVQYRGGEEVWNTERKPRREKLSAKWLAQQVGKPV